MKWLNWDDVWDARIETHREFMDRKNRRRKMTASYELSDLALKELHLKGDLETDIKHDQRRADMKNKERILEVLSKIAFDAEKDVKDSQGQELNGRNVHKLFAYQGASIQALANILTEVVKEMKGKENEH